MEKSSVPPAQCAGLEEIRAGMDALDQEIITLISQRVAYVRAAAAFKKVSTDVAAPERVAAVLKTRRELAEQAGLSGDVIEKVYRDLVAYSIAEEHKQWQKNQGTTNQAAD